MSNSILAQDLTVRYGRRRALTNLDLSIPAGTVGLLGPNGAGKSTLLKTVLGFLRPSSGRVELLGAPATTASIALRQRVGYFPERSVIVPGLSSVETVALAGELGGLNRTHAMERAHDVLWFTGLGEARYRAVESFSTGMQQRNKLAMALVHDPELLLLDEPTSGLDPSGRRQMLELVRQLAGRGVSVLLSTHLLHDVEQVCERVAVLKEGRLALEGELTALRREPGWVFELRVRESRAGAFKEHIAPHVQDLSEDRDGFLRITLHDPSTHLLFEVARAAEAEIRHLRRFEKSLEDRFLDAVGSTAGAETA